jgi:hypothetical protein
MVLLILAICVPNIRVEQIFSTGTFLNLSIFQYHSITTQKVWLFPTALPQSPDSSRSLLDSFSILQNA